jgi:hypothetical protein
MPNAEGMVTLFYRKIQFFNLHLTFRIQKNFRIRHSAIRISKTVSLLLHTPTYVEKEKKQLLH